MYCVYKLDHFEDLRLFKALSNMTIADFTRPPNKALVLTGLDISLRKTVQAIQRAGAYASAPLRHGALPSRKPLRAVPGRQHNASR
jgi:hypothetical protein